MIDEAFRAYCHGSYNSGTHKRNIPSGHISTKKSTVKLIKGVSKARKRGYSSSRIKSNLDSKGYQNQDVKDDLEYQQMNEAKGLVVFAFILSIMMPIFGIFFAVWIKRAKVDKLNEQLMKFVNYSIIISAVMLIIQFILPIGFVGFFLNSMFS